MALKATLRKPFFMKMWESHPKVWKAMVDVGILLKYKTLNIAKLPQVIKLPSTQLLYVNPNENRGRVLLIKNGITQSRLTRFWIDTVQTFKPTIIVDVGVNYGECIFSTNYPTNTKVFGVEANAYLIPYIIKSKEVHPNKEQITIVQAFASNEENGNQRFYVDKHWSGTSSGSYAPSHNMIEEHEVQTITIDSLLEGESIKEQRLLFKIDVEGYESFVLQGMSRIIKECDEIMGFIEFDSEYIKKSNTDLDAFLSFLNKYFSVFMYDSNDALVEISSFTYKQMIDHLGCDEVHTDLIVVKK
ncbi:FkbM family methyltransferase [Metabacillus iocasae]|uniref:FkbM family methyltransferase n=1 Tax=Priestia iocasae TaxID=2291674 RepID=A0ABS2QXL3_9BACI|nr:FkbM family methyltransferase [Metabacillus iocasae]MBM7703692.1 FkbM family methyltransferase [Metabacillus iocasae]